MSKGSQRIPAAVLIPVFRDSEEELRVVLVRRGSGGIHGDQLGFPGGKQEAGDGSLLDTALREAEEEIGLRRDAIEVVASLEPLDTLTSSFRVHPYLARITPPLQWRLAPGEIVSVIAPTVRGLAEPTARRERHIPLSSRRHTFVECIPVDDGQPLWGLTLRLLDALLPRLLAGAWRI